MGVVVDACLQVGNFCRRALEGLRVLVLIRSGNMYPLGKRNLGMEPLILVTQRRCCLSDGKDFNWSST